MTQASSLIAEYGFVCIALVIFAGEIGIPILVPGEVALLLAGNQLVHSPAQLVLACLALAATDLLATTLLHLAARSGGTRLLHIVLRRLVRKGTSPEDVMASWHRRLSAHDALVILIVRMVPGIRISASLISGLLRLRMGHFLLGATPASLVWTGVPLIVGYEIKLHIGSVPVPDTHLIYALTAGAGMIFLLAGSVWWVLYQHGLQAKRPGDGDRTVV